MAERGLNQRDVAGLGEERRRERVPAAVRRGGAAERRRLDPPREAPPGVPGREPIARARREERAVLPVGEEAAQAQDEIRRQVDGLGSIVLGRAQREFAALEVDVADVEADRRSDP